MLERVFSPLSQWYDRIWYDPREGAYYDMWADVYLSLEQLPAFGLGPR